MSLVVKLSGNPDEVFQPSVVAVRGLRETHSSCGGKPRC